MFADLTTLTDVDYPAINDAGTVVFDAQSQGKLYLALDSDTIHLLVGNFPVSMTRDG